MFGISALPPGDAKLASAFKAVSLLTASILHNCSLCREEYCKSGENWLEASCFQLLHLVTVEVGQSYFPEFERQQL